MSYGISPIRAVVLGGAGVPSRVVDAFTAITIGNWTVPYAFRILLLRGFGAVTLAIAMRAFARRD